MVNNENNRIFYVDNAFQKIISDDLGIKKNIFCIDQDYKHYSDPSSGKEMRGLFTQSFKLTMPYNHKHNISLVDSFGRSFFSLWESLDDKMIEDVVNSYFKYSVKNFVIAHVEKTIEKVYSDSNEILKKYEFRNTFAAEGQIITYGKGMIFE